MSNFLGLLWLRQCAPNAGGAGSIPGQEAKIPHALWPETMLELIQ